eukprot:CAMPEP_0184685488 /NCGR_PEP_ID=MMETSP0312-20130426/19169_1 /TAXON_ID=31354 /ORGANISM="Compsopogon coeruleus, Strain SAG 36.94" /LENGTH=47 /DNA_ID= /DNA_START= /DNA_END= /DNA_ORIENTATION=
MMPPTLETSRDRLVQRLRDLVGPSPSELRLLRVRHQRTDRRIADTLT